MLSIGKRLREARKKKRLSQENVRAITGISASRLSCMEKSSNLSAQQLGILCKCYDVSADTMLGLADIQLVSSEDAHIVGQWHALPEAHKAAGRQILFALYSLHATTKKQ